MFVSHSSKDLWVAARIAERIRACGAATFLDEADIAHGSNFDDAIADAARQCVELLVLLTPWSVERPYVWLEIGMFRYENKRIVGVLYGLDKSDIAKDERMPVVLKSINLIELNQLESYMQQLTRRVAAANGKPSRGGKR